MSSMNFLEKLLDGSEFQWKTLGDLGSFIRGSGIQKSDFTDSGAGCIHYGQIHTHYGTWATETKSFIDRDFAARLRKAHSGDLVIATTSEDDEAVAKAVAWLGNEEVAVSTDAYIYRHTVNPKYMSYFFQTDIFQSQKKPHITGTKVRRISGDSLAKIEIPIPCPENPKKSLEIQSEIVRILDAFTSLTAELTAMLSMRKKQYNYYRDQLLSFEEGEVEWKALGDVYKFQYGTGNTIPTLGGEYPVYGSNGIVGTHNEFNSEDSPVIGHIGAYAGIVNWGAGKHFVTYNGVICKLINKQVHPKYAYYQLLKQDFNSMAKSSSHPFVSYDALNKVSIPIPPPAEQAHIVAILDKFDALTNSITEGLPREIELRQKQYEYYRDLLLSFPKPEEVME